MVRKSKLKKILILLIVFSFVFLFIAEVDAQRRRGFLGNLFFGTPVGPGNVCNQFGDCGGFPTTQTGATEVQPNQLIDPNAIGQQRIDPPTEASKMIKYRGPNDASGNINKWDETSQTKDKITIRPKQEMDDNIPTIDLTNEILKQAENEEFLKDWDDIELEKRKKFLKDPDPEKVKEMSGDQLSKTEEETDIVTDPDSPKTWEALREDPEKATEVLKNKGVNFIEGTPLSNQDFNNWDFVRGEDGKLYFKNSQMGFEIPIEETGNYEFFFGKDYALVKNSITGSTLQVTGDLSWNQLTGMIGTSLRNPLAAPWQNDPGLRNPGNLGGNPGGSPGGSSQPPGGGDQGLQQVTQLLQTLIGTLGEAFKQAQSNGQGNTNVNQQPGGGQFGISDGAGLAFLDEEERKKLLAQKDGEDEAILGINDRVVQVSGDASIDAIIPQEAAIELPSTPETTLELNGIAGNAPFQPLASVLASPPGITGQAIIDGREINFGQFIKFHGHNLDMSGRDIRLYALKTFDEVEAGGQNLRFWSGNIEIKFDGQRIMYPRLVRNAPYGVRQISNKLDQRNKFRLQHYVNKRSKLTDNEEIVSVGDVSTNHPTKDLIISEIRFPMWKTG